MLARSQSRSLQVNAFVEQLQPGVLERRLIQASTSLNCADAVLWQLGQAGSWSVSGLRSRP
jgi:hypothetical protein